MRCVALLLAVTTLALARPSTAAAGPGDGRVSYRPPVEGPIVDPFRPPPDPWLAGNRGIDYTPGAGTPVKASADGEVVFAGQVGGELHVVLLHADGIRTSYSFLQSIAVHRGDKVRQGQVVGAAGDDLHFGARLGDTYIDPRTLFDDGPPVVYLVPDEVRRAGTEPEERSGLIRFLGVVRAVRDGVMDVVSPVVNRFPAAAFPTSMAGHAISTIDTTVAWWNQRNDCTPAGVPPPPMPERRVAVLVSGLTSNSDQDSLVEVDPDALGYADWSRFDYLGGAVTDLGERYTSWDTTVDLRTEARRLRELLERVHIEHPDDPVDIIAHSQGGIIARTALAYEYDPHDPRLPRVANLVTLASPHQGTDLATALTTIAGSPRGYLIERAITATGQPQFDLTGPSISQLAETTDYLRELRRRPMPPGVQFTSIGGRGDLIVPGVHTAGGHNIIVTVPGIWSDHRDLPGSDAGRREVALAIAGRPPTCQTLGNMLADTLVSGGISTVEDILGAVAASATR